MKEEVFAPDCGRENELIAFLYDELSPGDKTTFRRHMQECSSCSAELAEFTSIRESVVDWRNEALLGVSSFGVQASSAVRYVTKRSAVSALREFFNLSPLWMKGAVVFASLLFCLFAVLAAARLKETAPPPVAGDSNVKKYSDQELNAIVDQRVHDELQRERTPSAPKSTSPGFPTVKANQGSRGKANRVSELASSGPQQKARRPLSKGERQQLAADLRLVEHPTEGEIELLDDRINQ